jgi:hypothetical protein
LPAPYTIVKTKGLIVPAVTIHQTKGPFVPMDVVAIAPTAILLVLLFQVLPLRIQN